MTSRGKQLRESETDSQKASTLNKQLGTEYLRQGNLALAKEKLERAEEFNPRDPELHSVLAVLYQIGERERITHFLPVEGASVTSGRLARRSRPCDRDRPAELGERVDPDLDERIVRAGDRRQKHPVGFERSNDPARVLHASAGT